MMNRSKSVSVSEDDHKSPDRDSDSKSLGNVKKRHRRGKKRSRPKWKPYSKMSYEERKELEEWEAKRVILREAEINARSKRPVAPFNSTQFIIDDRMEETPQQPSLARNTSFESESSGEDVHYETSDSDFQEQEAFIEADFNQVYVQLRMNRLESMTKQDLVIQCYDLEDKVSSIEQEKNVLLNELRHLKQSNGELTTENIKLKENPNTNSSPN
jgi:protein HEXIM1/2